MTPEQRFDQVRLLMRDWRRSARRATTWQSALMDVRSHVDGLTIEEIEECAQEAWARLHPEHEPRFSREELREMADSMPEPVVPQRDSTKPGFDPDTKRSRT